MNNTPERAKEIDFVNYLFVGQSLVVRAGNPQGITSLETLCGHAAGSQVGLTNLDTINAANEACLAAGKEGIDVTGFRLITMASWRSRPTALTPTRLDSGGRLLHRPGSGVVFEFGGPQSTPYRSVSLCARTTRSCATRSRRRSTKCMLTAR